MTAPTFQGLSEASPYCIVLPARSSEFSFVNGEDEDSSDIRESSYCYRISGSQNDAGASWRLMMDSLLDILEPAKDEHFKNLSHSNSLQLREEGFADLRQM